MSFTAPYVFNAFTSSPTCGNPAAVVFLPTRIQQETLQKIASGLDQPITVFLSRSVRPACDHGVATFDVRWFTSTTEMPINGHGLIAAAAALLPQIYPHTRPTFFICPQKRLLF